MKRFLQRILPVLICLSMLFPAAAPGEETPSVTLSAHTLSLNVGETHTLTYTFTPAGSATDDWEWSLSKEGVVSVTRAGLVTALSPGTASVVFLTGSGLSDVCVVTVLEPGQTPSPSPSPSPSPTPTPAEGTITLTVPSDTREKGGVYLLDYKETLALKAVGTGSWQNAEVAWSVSNKRATVDENGSLTGQSGKAGNVVVTMKAENASTGETVVKTAKFHVGPALTSVTLNNLGLNLYTGGVTSTLRKKGTLKAVARPSGANYATIEWTSSKPEVAKVSAKGVVTALADGTSKITVTIDGAHSASCKVSVGELPTKVNLPKTVTIRRGATYNLKSKMSINGTIHTVRWLSKKPGVVAVNAKGVIKGMSVGATKIAVKTLNGLKDVCQVRVVAGKEGEEIPQADEAFEDE